MTPLLLGIVTFGLTFVVMASLGQGFSTTTAPAVQPRTPAPAAGTASST